MGWLPAPTEPCKHATRPAPRIRDAGRVWECDDCTRQFRVHVEDYGHDVMPGEAAAEACWRPA